VLLGVSLAAPQASAQQADGFGPPDAGAGAAAGGADAAATLDPSMVLDPAALAAMNAGNYADPNYGGFGGQQFDGYGGYGGYGGAMGGFGPAGGAGMLPPNTFGTPYNVYAATGRGQYITYSNPNAPPGMFPVHRMSLHYHAPKNLVYPPPNQPAGVVVYPYYTVRGPTCFFLDDDNVLNR
jgi:hypothetical protein